eukprot:1141042-Pelagomonas_calceolata.AAC.11
MDGYSFRHRKALESRASSLHPQEVQQQQKFNQLWSVPCVATRVTRVTLLLGCLSAWKSKLSSKRQWIHPSGRTDTERIGKEANNLAAPPRSPPSRERRKKKRKENMLKSE